MYAVEFARLWGKLSKELKMYMEDRLAPTLTEGQLTVLELLGRHGKMKPSDFVDYLETTPAAVTTLLDRMERGGLVSRTRDERDRRIVWVTATERGVAECERGVAVRQQFLEEHLNRISVHNQQLLVYLLGKVADA